MKPRANNPGLFVGGKQCSLIAIEDNLNFLTEPDVGCWHLASFTALQHFGSYWGRADMPNEFSEPKKVKA
jgi:hypothetical protein